MAEVAAHLTDQVLPWLPVREWVLSVAKRLRPYLHGNPKVASGVLRIFLRGVRFTLHATSPGAPASAAEIRIGAVSFLHRFGSSLNAHFHYHVVVLDGVFSETEEGGVEFHEGLSCTRDGFPLSFRHDSSAVAVDRIRSPPARDALRRERDGAAPYRRRAYERTAAGRDTVERCSRA